MTEKYPGPSGHLLKSTYWQLQIIVIFSNVLEKFEFAESMLKTFAFELLNSNMCEGAIWCYTKLIVSNLNLSLFYRMQTWMSISVCRSVSL